MDTPSGADILHLKALDAVSNLIARYEAGQITAETFKVGVETVWTCCGGVCTKDEFEELMREANAYARGLKDEPKIAILRGKGGSLILLERTGDIVLLTGAGGIKSGTKYFPLETDAIDYVRSTVEGHVKAGWVAT